MTAPYQYARISKALSAWERGYVACASETGLYLEDVADRLNRHPENLAAKAQEIGCALPPRRSICRRCLACKQTFETIRKFKFICDECLKRDAEAGASME